MFTGIIKGIGKVEKVSEQREVKKVLIKAPSVWKFYKGESVSVSGICSTVISSKKNVFNVEYMKETLSKTTAPFFKKGDLVNLEKSLKFGDSLDGHFVYGHVEATAEVLSIENNGRSKVFELALPRNIAKYVVNKGSISIDGVSLTVSKKSKNKFQVSLIPHTLSHTTLGKIKKGDKVNLESDLLVKLALKNKK